MRVQPVDMFKLHSPCGRIKIKKEVIKNADKNATEKEKFRVSHFGDV